MLRIKDNNLEITTINQESYKEVQTIVLYATLSPSPSRCNNCGCFPQDIEEKTCIVKNSTKEITVRFDSFNHLPMVMKLKKQKYYCRNCQSYFVDEKSFIANHVKVKINEFRVQEMKVLKAEGKEMEAKKIKANWRKFIKNSQSLDVSEFKSWRSFQLPHYHPMTESMLIDQLLSYSEPLKETYANFQRILYAFRTKQPELFFDLIEGLSESLDETFRAKCQNLLKYHQGITNAMKLPYSNGKIEARNTHIKTLKRVSYGFKSYTNMKTRIFLTTGLIRIK